MYAGGKGGSKLPVGLGGSILPPGKFGGIIFGAGATGDGTNGWPPPRTDPPIEASPDVTAGSANNFTPFR